MPPNPPGPHPSLLSAPARHPSFSRDPLRREDLGADPLVEFVRWLSEAATVPGADPFAMTLATVGGDGAPSARTVSLKDVDERGFVFTSQYDGPKGREMDADPRVALVFYWPEQGRQVRVTGTAERLPEEESARYFDARPRASRLALLAYPQSQPVVDRVALEVRVDDLARLYSGEAVPRPAWGGYVVRPTAVEFWQGQSDRLHDRFLYRTSGDGRWDLTRLAP
jgi:pyridoxamine 5'-phosphate oxidase